MGKEEDPNVGPNAIFPLHGFHGHLSAAHANTKVQDHVGWMSAAPRTPLRTLIARESGAFRTLSPPTHHTLPLKFSPTRKRSEAGNAHGIGILSPPSGSSSPSTFGTTRLGHASHKMRAFQQAAAIPPKPTAELRPVQLRAFFARDREKTRNRRAGGAEPGEIGLRTDDDGAINPVDDNVLVKNGQPPLRGLIAAERTRTCAPRAGVMPDDCSVTTSAVGHSFRLPSPGNNSMTRSALVRESKADQATKHTLLAPDIESQELRYLFAKDWALQTSDEDDEFWDSGSLCGVSVASPSPRSGHDQRRRRTKKLNSKRERLRHSSSSHRTTSGRRTPEAGTQPSSGMSSPLGMTTPSMARQRLDGLQELHAQSSARGSRFRFISEDAHQLRRSPGPKPSLGTLLAEEVATSRSASSVQCVVSAVVEPTWSVPVDGFENSRRPKIGSLSDISAPVRPESQSQLDFLIAKILTLRANSAACAVPRMTTTWVAESDDGGCATSGRMQSSADGVKNQEEDFLCGATDSSSSTAHPATATDENLSRVDAPNILLGMNPIPPISEREEAPNSAPSPQEETHSELVTSPLGEARIYDSAITGADAAAGAGETTARREVTDGDEPAEMIIRARSSNADNGKPEVEAPAPERVRLGTLLERARGEHGWLPLGRSRVGSPLTLVASSSTSSRLNDVSIEMCTAPPPDENSICPLASSSELFVPPRSCPGLPRSPESVHPSPFQQPASPPPATTTELALALALASTSPLVAASALDAAAAAPTWVRERPATQRVSLLSLLNQDMEMELEGGLHAEVLSGGCGDEDEEQADAEELDPMCCVCMVGHKGAAFIPCGHTFCRKCCREVRRTLGSCPLCNQAIVDVLKLY